MGKQGHLIYYTKRHSQVKGGHSHDRKSWSVKTGHKETGLTKETQTCCRKMKRIVAQWDWGGL